MVIEAAEITIENLMAKIKHYYPCDTDIIMRAFNIASKAHEGQVRASGRSYITHPCVVADILIDLGMDVDAVCAGLLHDTIEDTDVTDQMIREIFGVEVAEMVQGVTKLKKLSFSSKEDEQAENIRKMFFAMAKDSRIVIIKLADRLHNMRSLEHLSHDRQVAIAKETREIFAPLAGRLGISQIKCELEDLSLKYLEPDAYEYLQQSITMKQEERQDLTEMLIFELKSLLSELAVEGRVFGRAKHYSSIYGKMKAQNVTLDEIYDLIAVRVIVGTVKDCYNVLGGIHAKWKPLPGRIKDYIAVPKANMYQSLHTTVVTNFGAQFEIQIRTEEMNKIAEYGIAAHWKYKEGISSTTAISKKVDWISDILANEAESDSKDFLNTLKHDISIANEVFVFTPKGAVKSLPKEATTVDFAYAVHSEVGNKCVGAKVNGRIVSLDQKLEDGDVVEILTSANSKGPSRDWLRFAASSSTKNKIRQFFKRELKDENVKSGKNMLEREAKNKGIPIGQLLTKDSFESISRRYAFANTDEMFAAIGFGSINTNQVMFKLTEYHRQHSEQKLAQSTDRPKVSRKENQVVIKGYDDLLVRFSKCCSPVPGDEIVGYISHGRGITIHISDCPALKQLERERMIPADWSENLSGKFPVSLHVIAEDKGTFTLDITKIITNFSIPILAMNAKKNKSHNVEAQITVEIENQSQLAKLIDKMSSHPSTLNVYRTKI